MATRPGLYSVRSNAEPAAPGVRRFSAGTSSEEVGAFVSLSRIMRRVLISVVPLLLWACSGVQSPDRADRAAATHGDGEPTEAIVSRSPDASTPAAHAPIPAPDARIPSSPDRLADVLAGTTLALREAIDAWVDGEGLSAPPPRDVRLLAFYQQRLYWALTEDPELSKLTIPRLATGLAGEARANIQAGANIRSLVTPTDGQITLRTQRPEPAEDLLAYYREAEERFRVEWEVLAAVNYVESRFGRARSASPAGAQGPMQFLPETWREYGMGGDIRDPHDAILGAANFLSSGGAPRRYRRALYYYNHAWPYVDAVLLYARQMMRDPRDYLAYYNWPVVVLTTDGPEHLTGPGSR